MSISSINSDSSYLDALSSTSSEETNDSNQDAGLVANNEQNVTISSAQSNDDETGDEDSDDSVETDAEYLSDVDASETTITSGAVSASALHSLAILADSQQLWNQLKRQGESSDGSSDNVISVDGLGASQLSWTSIDPTQQWMSQDNESAPAPHFDPNSMVESLGRVSGQTMQMENGGVQV